MPLPAVRISFNDQEKHILLAGLVHLATAMIGPLAGYFPQARLAAAMWPDHTAAQKIPTFDRELAIAVGNLRKIIQTLRGKKVRLDVVQVTLCAFAVRVARGKCLVEDLDTSRFSHKLEEYRKRAKYKTKKHLGPEAYSKLGIRCRAFESWCQSFVLHFRLFRQDHPCGVLLHARQLAAQVRVLALEVLHERTATIVPDHEIFRIARLAVAEIHRDRHPFTMMSFVADEAKAKDFLFEFFSKRLELLPLASGANRVVEPKLSPAAETEPETQTDEAAKNVRASRVIDERAVFEASTMWFIQNVPWDVREQVKEEAIAQVMRFGNVFLKPTKATTLLDLIKELHPGRTADNVWDAINLLVEWLLAWVTALIKDPFRICQVVQVGFARAKNSTA